jgi:hypothetical protein
MSDGYQVTSDQVLQETGVAYRRVVGASEVTASKIAVRQQFLYECEKFHGWSHHETSRWHGLSGRPWGYRCLDHRKSVGKCGHVISAFVIFGEEVVVIWRVGLPVTVRLQLVRNVPQCDEPTKTDISRPEFG